MEDDTYQPKMPWHQFSNQFSNTITANK